MSDLLWNRGYFSIFPRTSTLSLKEFVNITNIIREVIFCLVCMHSVYIIHEDLWLRDVQNHSNVCYAESLQSCPTLCDPIDGILPGSPVPGILQARILEWVGISFSNAWKWKVKVKLLSRVWLLATPWTAAHQAPPSMGFSRQEYWSGVPLPSLILMYTVLYIYVCVCVWYGQLFNKPTLAHCILVGTNNFTGNTIIMTSTSGEFSR